ncbi:hypothetical protein B0A49_03244 [Cryomyces minteri]|uniref:GAT domain-containing protein n=1 Tax=Cryomyces minteri TaxID=331657 RepID=A0A4U0WZ67_9PEZI|nr:hypothetical protein B0A49_03244 [Cryomyces minteri]
MKKFTGFLNKSRSQDEGPAPAVDSPESNSARGVRLFCESGSMKDSGEEVLHLPVIVEAAESSPQAAAAAAHQIRRFLSKDHYNRPYVQYNAIMLIRILCDNPGRSFTKNMDSKFVTTVKELLRNGRDASVQQILRETLDALEADKAYDENLGLLFAMWRKEKGVSASLSHSQHRQYGPSAPRNFNVPAFDPNAPPVAPSQQQSSQRVFNRNQLPAPGELSARIEEARTTAKLLLQFLQSTPSNEVLNNELLKEFGERCQSAQRSIQEYINCDSPPPDDDTMQTLIETNEQLSLAGSRYQRSVLQARRLAGATATSTPPPVGNTINGYGSAFPPPSAVNSDASYIPPPGPPPGMQSRLQQRTAESSGLPEVHTDPFGDEHAHPHPLEPTNYGPPLPRRPPQPQPSMPTPPSQPYPPPQHEQSEPLGIAPPQSPPRPGAYHNGPTPSYIHRQASAANGLTMHGAAIVPEIAEMDGESAAGSAERVRTRELELEQQRNRDSVASTVSPLEPRAPAAYRY